MIGGLSSNVAKFIERDSMLTTLLVWFNLHERRHVALRVRVVCNLMPARPITQTPTGNKLSLY